MTTEMNSGAAGTQDQVWSAAFSGITAESMALRVKAAASRREWREVIRIFADRKVPADSLKVAEVGCGTGTMALTFRVMGASAALIDNNPAVLDTAKKIWDRCGYSAEFVNGDCTDDPPESLEGKFDLVISSGVAEHFVKDDRRRCLEYHKKLAKDGGIVMIAVPNRMSALYWIVRGIRTLTGTWEIETEIPYTGSELKRLAVLAGLKDPYVIGYVNLWRDLIDYFYGIRSAIADSLPEGVVRFFGGRKPKSVQAYNKEEVAAYCRSMAGLSRARRSVLTDNFSSNIVLFAFK